MEIPLDTDLYEEDLSKPFLYKFLEKKTYK